MAEKEVFIHPTAVVDEGAVVGAGTKIWHFCHVMGGAEIGEDCTLGQNIVVLPGVRIGRNFKAQGNTIIGDGAVIEEDVFCGPNVAFTNVLNPRSHVSRRSEFKPTRVCRGVTLGAHSTIVCDTTLGEYCFIGAGAVVTNDVPPHALVLGVPGRVVGWMSAYGERLDFGSGDEAVCPGSGERYRRVSENRIERIDA